MAEEKAPPGLAIVVPFYDEEAAIEDVLRRCVETARRLGGEVVAVDDGSRDGSAARARRVEGARVVSHPANRGYGAALKTGFAATRAPWVAFLDADGTCDPACLEALYAKARGEDLDVVIGARLHGESRMPAVRSLGNCLFRCLAALCGAGTFCDVASGIRVVRRAAYERMAPLPDGMDFTPAMSARALLDPALRIAELPVSYGARVGTSKLRPLPDGLRFARVILESGIVYRPRAVLGWAAGGLLALAAALFSLRLGGPSAPLATLLAGGEAQEWMYFRFILMAVCVAMAGFGAALGLVLQALVDVVHRDRSGAVVGPGPAAQLAGWLPVAGSGLFLGGVLANARPLSVYLKTGHIPAEYWVRPIVGGVLTGVGIMYWGFWVAARVADLLWRRETARREGA